MSVTLSGRERTALAAIAEAGTGHVNGVQLRTALRTGGFPGASVQGAHQTAASLVRKRLAYKDYGPRGVTYGPVTVDGAEALNGGQAWQCEDCGWQWPLPGEPPEGSECDPCGGELVRS